MANQAAFTIDGTPSEDPATGDRAYVAVNGQTLTVALEQNPSPALSALFEVFDPLDGEAPLASKNAPLLTWNENGLAKIVLGPVPFGINDPVTVDIPGGGILAYLIRCTVGTAGDGSPGSQQQVFERLVLVYSVGVVPPIRKTIPGESTQARARGWSDAINDMVDAIAASGATHQDSATLRELTGGAEFKVPAGYELLVQEDVKVTEGNLDLTDGPLSTIHQPHNFMPQGVPARTSLTVPENQVVLYTGEFKVAGLVKLRGLIKDITPGPNPQQPATSPAALAANQNNWQPNGDLDEWEALDILLVNCTVASNVTGISGSPFPVGVVNNYMRKKRLLNVGSQNMTLTHEDVLSTATARFHNNTGGSLVVAPDQMVELLFDPALERWRAWLL